MRMLLTVEKKIDKLKQKKFIPVEKFRALPYFIYIYIYIYLYESKKPRPHWAQGPDMITSSQGPSLIPHTGPFEQSSLKGLACLLVLIHARPAVP